MMQARHCMDCGGVCLYLLNLRDLRRMMAVQVQSNPAFNSAISHIFTCDNELEEAV